MGKRLCFIFFGLALLAGACSSGGVKGPQTYRVAMDAPSPNGPNYQFSAFYPALIKVRPGDTVVFNDDGSAAPHTLTFGVKPDRSNQPSPETPDGKDNPAVWSPCAAPTVPTAPSCPSKSLPAYNGSGYYNAGSVLPAAAKGAPHSVTLKLSSSIAPGRYPFMCLLHGPMTGIIQVVGKDSDRSSPADVSKETSSEQASARSAATSITPPSGGGLSGTTFNAYAGWAKGATAVNKFSPDVINVKAGTTVSWTAPSYEPHTVSFGPSFHAGDTSPGFAPIGGKNGSVYTGGVASSGIFSMPPAPVPAGPFKLTFTKPGTYNYVCLLHPGMTGTVKVT